jgi:hypothetical protein
MAIQMATALSRWNGMVPFGHDARSSASHYEIRGARPATALSSDPGASGGCGGNSTPHRPATAGLAATRVTNLDYPKNPISVSETRK